TTLFRSEWELGAGSVEGDAATGAVVRVPVRNTGLRLGSTVVQVYVEPPRVQSGRPLRTLAGFAKVHAAAGEEVVAEVALSPRAFAHWDAAARRWATASGDHRVVAGLSSAVDGLTTVGVCRAPAPG
ncbi:MAG TPA: glycosyl hydrolase, partial [Acidimicrobiaceae bacterium]|nr:glycosyl hydrolase [Acidimicrobiaceae bacterium]